MEGTEKKRSEQDHTEPRRDGEKHFFWGCDAHLSPKKVQAFLRALRVLRVMLLGAVYALPGSSGSERSSRGPFASHTANGVVPYSAVAA